MNEGHDLVKQERFRSEGQYHLFWFHENLPNLPASTYEKIPVTIRKCMTNKYWLVNTIIRLVSYIQVLLRITAAEN